MAADEAAEARDLRIRSLRIVLITAAIASIFFFLFTLFGEGPRWKRLPVGIFGLAALTFALLDLRRLGTKVAWVFLSLVWGLATFGMIYNGGVFGTAGYTLFLLVLCSAFILPPRGVLVATGVSLSTVTGIYLLDHLGLLAPRASEYSSMACLIALDVQLLAGGLFLALVARQAASLFRRLASARQEALASEARLRVFYESAFEGIALSREGAVIDLNDRAAQILGRAPEALIGKQIADFIPPDEIARVQEHLRRDDGEPYEHHLIHFSGEKIPVRVQTRNLFVGLDHIRASTFIDLRPELAAAAREDTLKERLHRAQRLEAIGTLASGIAHEFNNLLAAIQAFVQLAEAASSGQVEEDLRDALRATERGRVLVTQILASSQRTWCQKELVDLGELLREVSHLLEVTLPKSVRIDTSVGAGGKILGDTGALHQVLLNLANNAVHAMKKQTGTLTLGMETQRIETEHAFTLGLEPGPYLTLSVRDDGEGMEADTLEHCLDPFFTTKSRGQGTGLGLSVVHGIIHSHRGAIDIESTPGEGSCFQIYLPLAAQKEEPAEDHAPRPEDATPAPENDLDDVAPVGRVLYADDEETLCRAMQRLLVTGGFDAEACESAAEALARIEDDPGRYQVILTDYAMPQMNGLELVRALRARGVRTPVILCSGNVDIFSSEEIQALDIHRVLQKPCAANTLRSAVGKALSGVSHRDSADPASSDSRDPETNTDGA